jgi:mannose-6-phosphate isomerase-like protein (cupin superfamily)
MSKIVITNVEEAPWVRESQNDAGRKTGVQVVGEVQEGMRAFIMNVAPDYETEVHSHSQDEVIVVVEGELRMGNRVLGPNSILLIPKDIQYRLGAGKDGARFINVRPGPADYQPVGKPVVTSEQIYGQSATIP